MANTLIDWNDGEGSIVASYEGDGDGSLRFSSTTANEDVDRSQRVQVAAAGSPLEVEVTVSQTGLRQVFCTAQAGNPEFLSADGKIFAVLKD